jgi:hypothetical protein
VTEEGGRPTEATKKDLIEKRQKNERGDNDFENCCNMDTSAYNPLYAPAYQLHS